MSLYASRSTNENSIVIGTTSSLDISNTWYRGVVVSDHGPDMMNDRDQLSLLGVS
jgi:hypothetical protein